jgi:hypothetical protein
MKPDDRARTRKTVDKAIRLLRKKQIELGARHEGRLHRALQLCPAIPPGQVAAHVACLRNRSKYFGVFQPLQIAEHLLLLDELRRNPPVVATVRRRVKRPDIVDILVVGTRDDRGLGADIWATLGDMGFNVGDCSPFTYWPQSKFGMAFEVDVNTSASDESLKEELIRHLRAKYRVRDLGSKARKRGKPAWFLHGAGDGASETDPRNLVAFVVVEPDSGPERGAARSRLTGGAEVDDNPTETGEPGRLPDPGRKPPMARRRTQSPNGPSPTSPRTVPEEVCRVGAPGKVDIEAVRAKLRRAIEESGLTHEQIGVRMGLTAAAARTVISRLLSSHFDRDPRLSTLLALAQALGRPLRDLL